jgi:signal recognition particle subunit SRP54
MFDNLSEKLQRVFKGLRGEGKLTAANMEVALREIRVALLEVVVFGGDPVGGTSGA